MALKTWFTSVYGGRNLSAGPVVIGLRCLPKVDMLTGALGHNLPPLVDIGLTDLPKPL